MGQFWGCLFVFGLIGMEERLSGGVKAAAVSEDGCGERCCRRCFI
ncbi:hypothetical protein NC651_006586 [Populus alba x Populus x berolinensis]|nr:hypothetical protein NC651_006586 [Populus alba x Populus x berolinensis]